MPRVALLEYRWIDKQNGLGSGPKHRLAHDVDREKELRRPERWRELNSTLPCGFGDERASLNECLPVIAAPRRPPNFSALYGTTQAGSACLKLSLLVVTSVTKRAAQDRTRSA
jgi:hypothetical protein